MAKHTDTSRSGDLVKRLRKRREVETIGGYERIEWEDEDALEAADRIEALTAENERLREAMRDAITEIETGAPLTGNDILSAALGEKQ